MPTLADLLVDFGKPKPRPAAFGDAASAGMQMPAFAFSGPAGDEAPGFDDMPGMPFDLADTAFDPSEVAFEAPTPPPDIDAIVAEAVASAEASLAERLEAEFAERLDARDKAHAEELERLQREAGEATGMRIADEFAALEKRLSACTSDVVARLLAPVLTEDLQRKAVASLVAVIDAAIRDSGAVRIRVRGPLSLFEMLEARLGEHSGRVEFTETQDFDLQVAVDESLYETRLSDWSQSLAGAFP
ncbi:hypothetical protein EJC49_13440 [Aquibium carbonis]|uniref:Flagellar assembly protein FliH n=1 Tax=Aquibium carbonis TaxID=2495581 RepID=A0A429YWJ7_9HYPH|nr:hypothetical protein [Aquibium carbonis]RST85845.1 hypothetical protein EJC49_13440 [Aquibium carbonis]